MRRLLYLATLSMLVMLVLAPTALAQTVETVPLNPDGACPEGFVTVNAAYKQPEKNSEQGRGERKDYETRKERGSATAPAASATGGHTCEAESNLADLTCHHRLKAYLRLLATHTSVKP